MPLIPTPVTLSSLPALHTLRLSGDASSPIVSVLLPHGASPASVAHFVKQSEREMRDPRSTSRLLQMVDSETGEVACYNAWSFVVGRKAGDERENRGEDGTEAGGEVKDFMEEWPEDAYVEAINSLHAEGNKMMKKWTGGKDYACLATLVTAPNHRRKGAASQLISIGLALADAHHFPAYVEATPDGLSLYLKHGFQQVDSRTIDLTPWGNPVAQEYSILLRPAAPAMSPSSFSVSPYLTNADFLDFAKIEDKAFQMTPLARVLFPPPPDPNTPRDPFKRDGMEIRAASLLEMAINNPTVRLVKAFLPETHEMVGWAKWNFYLDSPNPPQPNPIEWPPGANLALGEHFLDALYRPRDFHMRGKAYFFMHILCVLPEYQRKGIGKRMLEWGLKQADELGVECWIDATPTGLGLYKQYGWKEVTTTTVDLESYGGTPGEKEVSVQLIRPPQSLRE